MQLDLVPLVVVERPSLRSQIQIFDPGIDHNDWLAAHQLKIGNQRLIAYVEDNAVRLARPERQLNCFRANAGQWTVYFVHDPLAVVYAYDLAWQRRRDQDF
ncbi:hypothetical protein BpHYR1_039698 [Brachionus plicatilis]|uniref:Uncharacterized protein n=1 Tax=Brachionus plicatilis TaxID=10195 RepID=A0A3M7QC55_BRAPC|nr:hypothetical protein BpHYR1_039698 [Brachionus plicatilis]